LAVKLQTPFSGNKNLKRKRVTNGHGGGGTFT